MSDAKTTQQEPSMEEILSSIRRIIADEEKDRSAAGAPAPSFAAADDDVLELTDVAEDAPATPAPPSTPPTPAAA